jgi:plastocyanin
MISSVFVAVATSLFAGNVLAQTNHVVQVGGAAGLVFTPNQITAAIGDTVEFQFIPKAAGAQNHSVTQSPFATPCTFLKNATTGLTGFDSGFMPVPANAPNTPSITVNVTVSTPIWFFCAQGKHCESGMVGAINAPTTGNKTFAAFQALAMTQTVSTGSGLSGPTGNSSSSSTSSGSGSGSGTSASGSASSSASGSSSTTGSTSSAVNLKQSGLALVLAAGLMLFFV